VKLPGFTQKVWSEIEDNLASNAEHEPGERKFLMRTELLTATVSDGQETVVLPTVLREAAQPKGD